MKIVNLTPHAINFVDQEGNAVLSVEPSGNLARVSSRITTVDSIDGIPVTETVFGEVEGLPAEQDGVIYLVSAIVAARCPNRTDVFIPSESVRDDKGRIIGCKSLGRV